MSKSVPGVKADLRRAESPVEGLSKAHAAFAEAGLAFPRLPGSLAKGILQLEPWLFSTRRIRLSPYNLDAFVREAEAGVVDDYAILAHAGHGVNSWALHYYLLHGPLLMLLQFGWGGAYMDAKKSALKIKEGFLLADGLVELVDREVKQGRMSSFEHLRIIASDFYGARWSPPGTELTSPTEGSPSEADQDSGIIEVLKAALVWTLGRAGPGEVSAQKRSLKKKKRTSS